MKTRRAESIIEYAFLIGLIATALLAMQTYLKRGVQGVIKATADDLGLSTEQYYIMKNPQLPLDSQTIGIGEKGLIAYTKKDGSPVETEATIQKNITLTEAIVDPIRTVTYNQDQTKTRGEWVTTYTGGESQTYSALQRIQGGEVIKTGTGK